MNRRTLSLLLVTGLLAGLFVASASAEDKLPDLRRKLLEAKGDARIGAALDKLSETVGKPGFFEDHGAFGDWLGTIPDGRADHPLVRLRRGWAYVAAKRGKEAIPHVRVKPEILGGLVVRTGDTIYDGSVRRRLDSMRRRLLEARIPAGAAGSDA